MTSGGLRRACQLQRPHWPRLPGPPDHRPERPEALVGGRLTETPRADPCRPWRLTWLCPTGGVTKEMVKLAEESGRPRGPRIGDTDGLTVPLDGANVFVLRDTMKIRTPETATFLAFLCPTQRNKFSSG